MKTKRPGFLQELKRRHVWRIAIAYVVAGWLLVQVATQVFPFFNIPNWTVRLVVVLVVTGLPVAVVLAWLYEITPDGLRRTESADSPDARSTHEYRVVGQKLNAIITTVLVLTIAMLGWRIFAMKHPGAHAPVAGAHARSSDGAGRNPAVASTAPDVAAGDPAAPGLQASARGIPEKSIAVLPFANESGKDEQFFSDGLSEDLINALSQFEGLKVISRNSAFQFRDSESNANEIGRKLGVAHLLEGSVRRVGDDVRITATLVSAVDGSIVWSQHYDKPYRDLFALQDAIAQAVADALQARLVLAPGAVMQSDRPPGGNLAAYAAYQRGMALTAMPSEANTRRAIDAFIEATRLDPRYAAAYAQLSVGWIELFAAWSAPATEVVAKARAAVDTSLRLDPESSLARQAHARILQLADMDWRGAEAEARRALQLAPHDPNARIMLGLMLAKLGQVGRAVELTRAAQSSNPRLAIWYVWLSRDLAATGQLDDARNAILTAIALRPGGATFHTELAIIETLRGDASAALAAAQQETDLAWREWGLALALQIGPDRGAADDALNKLIAHQGSTSAYSVAEVHALRRDPDPMFKWLDRAWAQGDPGVSLVLYDPLILRYRHDPRFVVFCQKVGLPTTTDAIAVK